MGTPHLNFHRIPISDAFFFINFVISTITDDVKINTGVADKFLAPPGRKQATATEDFEFHISYL